VAGYGEAYPGVDIVPIRLDSFADYAPIGSEMEWSRYSFAHITAVFDKSGGDVQATLAAMEFIAPDVAPRVADKHLDDYLNSTYRSVKNGRDGDDQAGMLDAAESLPALLGFLFALDRRVRPYNKFLRWELQHHLLPQLPWEVPEFVEMLLATARGDTESRRRLLDGTVKVAREQGHEAVLDSWSPTAWRTLLPDA
jgi:hypothetical protein